MGRGRRGGEGSDKGRHSAAQTGHMIRGRGKHIPKYNRIPADRRPAGQSLPPSPQNLRCEIEGKLPSYPLNVWHINKRSKKFCFRIDFFFFFPIHAEGMSKQVSKLWTHVKGAHLLLLFPVPHAYLYLTGMPVE